MVAVRVKSTSQVDVAHLVHGTAAQKDPSKSLASMPRDEGEGPHLRPYLDCDDHGRATLNKSGLKRTGARPRPRREWLSGAVCEFGG